MSSIKNKLSFDFIILSCFTVFSLCCFFVPKDIAVDLKVPFDKPKIKKDLLDDISDEETLDLNENYFSFPTYESDIDDIVLLDI